MTTVPVTGAPGFRFWKDLYPSGRQGGLNYYPYSSIISGLTPSWSLAAAAPAAAAANITVAVAAGSAYLDSQIASLASSANVTVAPGTVVNGVNTYRIYLNPTRKLTPIALGASAPTTRLNGDAVADGDQYTTSIDFGEYFGAVSFFERVSGTWTAFDPSFKAPVLPAQPGKNRQWGNENYSKLTATNFTVNQIEKRIFIENMYPAYTSANSKALLRDVASLEIATASVYYHVLPLAVEATFTNGSASVTVSAAFRALVADIAASVTNTNTLAIDAAALATSGYNSGTGVITLGANYAGTTGTKTVNITPVTPANIVILSPARSVLTASMNLTNP